MILLWLTLLLIPLFCFILGFLIVKLLINQASWTEDWLALVFASLSMGLAIVGITAVFLAEIGWFSIQLLLLCWLIFVGALALLASRLGLNRRPFVDIKGKMPRAEAIFLLIWLPAMLWLMLRPHQFITGAADAGVYVSLGANIAQNGSIVIFDSLLAELNPILQEAFLRPVQNPIADAYLFPAFFATNPELGELMPQFYPLHPVWQAIVFSTGGTQAELLLPGIWGILGTFAVYLTTRKLTNWRVAALAMVAFSLNALQVWFARYPTSETLTQYFFWTGIWSSIIWLENRQSARLWALLAGISLGMTFLTRIDMLFLLPLLLFLIVWQWRRKQAAWAWFTLSSSLLCLYSVVHAMWQSQPYFYELYNYALNSLLRGPTGLLLATSIGFIGLTLFVYFYDTIMLLLVRYERPLRLLIIISLVSLTVYAWFIRPATYAQRSYLDAYSTNNMPVLDGENLIRLGWYLSPVGIWLGLAGICLLVWYADWQKSVLLMMGLFFAIFYIWRVRNNPVQIYAMRRYLPVVVPLLVIGSAYFIGWIANHKQRWAQGLAVTLAVLWLGATVWSARGFVSRIDYVGVPEQIAQLRGEMGQDAIVIFNDPQPIGQGDILGTPLKFIHGVDVFTLRNPDVLTTAVFDEAIAQWQADGRTVYWVDVAEGHPWPSAQWQLVEVSAYQIETTVLEARYDRKPVEILDKVWSGKIMAVKPAPHE